MHLLLSGASPPCIYITIIGYEGLVSAQRHRRFSWQWRATAYVCRQCSGFWPDLRHGNSVLSWT